jgi:hypothetical protein
MQNSPTKKIKYSDFMKLSPEDRKLQSDFFKINKEGMIPVALCKKSEDLP